MLWQILLVLLVLFCSFLSANTVEPAFLNRQQLLEYVIHSCPLPLFQDSKQRVIKPVWGSHNGKGVNVESHSWTIPICEQETNGSCFAQVYHPGPWEGRLTREDHEWKITAWKVPWLDTRTDPPAIEPHFPWVEEVKYCLTRVLPQTPFLALDFRTNGFDILPLEINGAYGLTYEFVLEKKHIMMELVYWILLRSLYGFYNVDQWVFRLAQNMHLWYHKWKTRRVPSQVWF